MREYEGKVVVLDFWASWCVACRRSFPWWSEMHAKYRDEGLIIIGVNLDNDAKATQKFLAEFPVRFRIYYDDARQLAEQYDIRAMPSTIVIGRNGEIHSKHFGFKVKLQDDYEAELVDALRYRE